MCRNRHNVVAQHVGLRAPLREVWTAQRFPLVAEFLPLAFQPLVLRL